MHLIDKYNRTLDYLRISVTDRCNLRCNYCMPEDGIEFLKRRDLMTYEELLRFARLMSGMGIKKIRITGGEPFVRKDLCQFIDSLHRQSGCPIHVTTNATLLHRHLKELPHIGIKSVNVSLDTLDRGQFERITRRDEFDKVWNNILHLLDTQIRVKLNMVVQSGINENEIGKMAQLASMYPVEVRFIEEMPFNGSTNAPDSYMSAERILEKVSSVYPSIMETSWDPNSSAIQYEVKNIPGRIAIIPAYSRLLCGSCNRLRITPVGMLRTCLYDPGTFNVRNMMRAGASDEELRVAIHEAVLSKAKNGHEAEKRALRGGFFESMATIGG